MKNLSIKLKFIFCFSVVLILFIVTGLITFRSLKQIKTNDDLVNHTYLVLSQIEIVYSSLKDAQLGERGYVLTGNKNYLDPYDNAVRLIPEQNSKLKQLVTDINQKQRLVKIDSAISKTLAAIDKAIILRDTKGFDSAQKYVTTNIIKDNFDSLRSVMDEMIRYETILLDQRNVQTAKSNSTAQTSIIGITIIAFILVVFISYTLTRLIVRPIIEISEVADRIAKGDLSGEIHLDQKDEIGIMARSFEKMNRSFIEMTSIAENIAKGDLTVIVKTRSEVDVLGKALSVMAQTLRNQINEIREGINILASSSSEIMASVTQMASSSSETSTSVGETTTTIEEIKQTAEISSQKARLVSENAVKTVDISKEGISAIAKTLEGMKRIKAQMDSITSNILKLSEQSQIIGEITAAVNELAEQSNLLAVNAAIEAAKAGEQGKGFTVVAQEIKNLSQRSKEATEQVRNILREIQKSISASVMVTEEGGRVVNEGIEFSASAGEVIKFLAENISNAANAAIQIAASSQQQLEGMDQIVSAMENIKESTIHSAAGTKQSVDSVTGLHKLGEKLNQMMDHYKV
jgi:methyl-accepting chemotaxis protein